MSDSPDKNPRNLSGLYFFHKNPVSGEREPYALEDIPSEVRLAKLRGKDEEFLLGVIDHLCNTLRNTGDKFDLYIDYDKQPDNES